MSFTEGLASSLLMTFNSDTPSLLSSLPKVFLVQSFVTSQPTQQQQTNHYLNTLYNSMGGAY